MKTKNNNNCTLLVNSCDKYNDIWDIFFVIFKNRWQNCPFKIVLNTESLKYSHAGVDVSTFSLYNGGDTIPWGKRLIDTLKKIESKYIFFVMDDFLLEEDVDQAKVDECIWWMEKDKEIEVFYFSNIVGDNINDCKYKGFELLPKRKDYKLNSAPAIWRRESLIKYTGEKDTPWVWEFFGSARTYTTNKKFYCANPKMENVYVYKYDLGGAIHKGKWVKSVIMPLAEKYKSDINFDIRGFEEESVRKHNERSSIKHRIEFFFEGFKVIGFRSFVFAYRSVNKSINGVYRKIIK